ncbi:MAG: hypothetical protein EOO38_05415, partial [Cytophagaceae bacterium]
MRGACNAESAREWHFLVRCAILAGSAEIRLQNSYQEVIMYAVIKTGGKQYRVASGEK